MKSYFSSNKIKLFTLLLFAVMIFGFSFEFCFAEGPESVTDLIGGAAGTAGGWIGTGLGNVVTLIVGMIAYLVTAVIGLLITVLIKILVAIAVFNKFIDQPVVVQGWVVIRDLCNMFFVVILLVIAFGTILKVNNNTYSLKTLPKLLLMAVLINFSRTIFGLIIDAAQVVMLTFVAAFSDGGSQFIKMFRVNEWWQDRGSAGTEAAGQWAVLMSMIAGVIASVVTLIIIVMMLAILVIRIVMLWLYTILSPVIFLGFAFPPLHKHTGKLWEDFIKHVTVGPILAFFIWLALLTASTFESQTNMQLYKGESVCVGASAFFCDQNLLKFIVVIGFLMGGMTIASQVSGAAGKIAGKGLATAKSWGTGIVKGSAKTGGAAGLSTLGGVLGLAGWGMGKKFAPDTKLGKVGRGLSMAGTLGMNWGGDIRAGMKKSAVAKRKKFLETAGFGEKTADVGKKILDTTVGKTLANMAGAATAGAGIAGLGGAVLGGGIGLGITLGADWFAKKTGKMEEVETDPIKKWIYGKAKTVGNYTRDFTTTVTAGATGEIAKDIQTARKQMKPAGDDASFWPEGDARYNKAFMTVLAEDSPASNKARGAAETWIKGVKPDDAKEVARARELAKNLAKYKNLPGSDMSRYASLVKEIDLLQGRVATGGLPADKQMKTVDGYAGDGIAYRKTGKEGIQGTGKASIAGVGAFAKGKTNQVDVPLARMNNLRKQALKGKDGKGGKDIDTTADAIHLETPELVAAAKQDMVDFFSSEIARMQALKPEEMGKGKEIKSVKYRDRTVKQLQEALARVQSTDFQPESLDLVNSAGINYGMKEKKISAYHEAYHDKVKNEDLTESLANMTHQTQSGRSLERVAGIAGQYEAEMNAKGVNINAGNADFHAQEIFRRAESDLGGIISEIKQAFAKSGGQEINVSNLSPKARKVLEDYQMNSVSPQILHHESELDSLKSYQDRLRQASGGKAAAEVDPEIQANQKAIDSLRQQATKRTFALDDPIIQGVMGDLENQKASYGSRADRAIARQNAPADTDSTIGETVAEKARQYTEREVAVHIPEMEDFKQALADFKTGAGKVGTGGADFNNVEQLLAKLNYNMFQVYKVLLRQSSAGGPVQELASKQDDNGEEKDTVPLDTAVVSQAIGEEIKQA